MELLPLVPAYVGAAWLRNKNPVAYNAMIAAGKNNFDHRYNFAVAHVNAVAQVEEIQKQLDKALNEGLDFAKWKQNLIDSGITIPHTTTVWRTNIFSALNQGRYDRFVASAHRRPYLLYESIEDSKTRPNHAANNGLCMRIDNPSWEGHVPPLGFNCRCILTNLTQDEAKSRTKLSSPSNKGQADSAEWGASPFKVGQNAKTEDIKPTPENIFNSNSIQKPDNFNTDVQRAVDNTPTLLTKNDEAAVNDVLRKLPAGYDWYKNLAPKQQQVLQWYAGGGADTISYTLANIQAGTGIDLFAMEKLASTVKLLKEAINAIPIANLQSRASNVADVARSDVAVANRTLTRPLGRLQYNRYVEALVKLGKLKEGDIVEFQGAQSFNTMGAVYDSKPAVEFLITKSITGKHFGRASKNFTGDSEDEVFYWSPKFKFVRRDFLPYRDGSKDVLSRYYFEEVSLPANIFLSNTKSGRFTLSDFSLFKMPVDEWLKWVP